MTINKTQPLDLTYNDYLKVPELLNLQVPQSRPPHHDEMLFIIIHQAYELWFKLILHEMEQAMACMQDAQVLKAHHFLKRIVEIMHLLVQQIHVLETMTAIDFLEFRERLMPASGFQSVQFREIEFLAGLKEEKFLLFFKDRPEMLTPLKKRLQEPDLKSIYFELLKKLTFEENILDALKLVYQNPEKNLPLYLLSEELVELDEYLMLWREHHVHVVERIIGHKPGTGGSSGVEYLKSTTTKKCFPELWEVRNHLHKKS